MKTLRQILFENNFSNYPDYPENYHHQSEIEGHRIGLFFDHKPKNFYDQNSNHYNTSFSVNNQTSRSRSKVSSSKILRHLGNKVSSFIKEKKPQSLTFHAGDVKNDDREKKHKIYGLFAKHLAKKHGGRYEEHREGTHNAHWTHQVHF